MPQYRGYLGDDPNELRSQQQRTSNATIRVDGLFLWKRRLLGGFSAEKCDFFHMLAMYIGDGPNEKTSEKIQSADFRKLFRNCGSKFTQVTLERFATVGSR